MVNYQKKKKKSVKFFEVLSFLKHVENVLEKHVENVLENYVENVLENM